MSITQRDPNTIFLGGGAGPGGEGGYTRVNDLVASASITPGMLIEGHNASGVRKLRPHATASAKAPVMVAAEQLLLNMGVDDAYGVGALVDALILHKGSTFWGIVGSGQDIAIDDLLESAGDGKFKEGSTNPLCKALDSTGGAVTADTRVRMEVI